VAGSKRVGRVVVGALLEVHDDWRGGRDTSSRGYEGGRDECPEYRSRNKDSAKASSYAGRHEACALPAGADVLGFRPATCDQSVDRKIRASEEAR
jgi:hypothetical protein